MAKKEDSEPGRQKALERTLQAIERQYGKGTIWTLGESGEPLKVAAISTGSLALDMALGVGGVPRGRVIEVYGPEASGKTTLALQIISNAQKAGGLAAFVDADGVAERRIVTLGRHNGIEAEVLDGLGEGVRVIVHPSDRIADGVEIEARPD